MSIDLSPRYMVVGLYVDRSRRTVRIYPLPFVRLSVPLPRRTTWCPTCSAFVDPEHK